MRLFSLETKRYIHRPISLSTQDFRDSLCVARGAFGPLFAVDQQAKINLYGKSEHPAEVNVWSTRQ